MVQMIFLHTHTHIYIYICILVPGPGFHFLKFWVCWVIEQAGKKWQITWRIVFGEFWWHMDWASIKSGADIWTSIDCHAGIGADMDIWKMHVARNVLTIHWYSADICNLRFHSSACFNICVYMLLQCVWTGRLMYILMHVSTIYALMHAVRPTYPQTPPSELQSSLASCMCTCELQVV